MVSLHKDKSVLADFAFMEPISFTYDLKEVDLHSKKLSQVVVKVKVARKSSYYLWNVGLIMLLICSFTLCAWALHPADIGERLAVDFALLLTAVAFKLILATMLPPISYLTTLDIYIMSGFLFITACTVAHCLLPLQYTEVEHLSPLS